MLIGNQEVGREAFPSYVEPGKQPYHMYQSLQDTANRVLNQVAMQVQQNQLVQNTPENRPSQWSKSNG